MDLPHFPVASKIWRNFLYIWQKQIWMVSGLRDSAMEYGTQVTWEDNPQLRGHFIHFDPLLVSLEKLAKMYG